jgi:hypothetical protein
MQWKRFQHPFCPNYILKSKTNGLTRIKSVNSMRISPTRFPVTAFRVKPIECNLLNNMPTAEDYRRRADECLAAARAPQDENERAMLMRLFEQWLRLADYKQRGRN